MDTNIFADFQTSEMLKKFGLNSDCFAHYRFGNFFYNSAPCNYNNKDVPNDNNFCSAPTWEQVEDFLWEKWRIYIKVEIVNWDGFFHWISYKYGKILIQSVVGEQRDNPKSARIHGIQMTIRKLYHG